MPHLLRSGSLANYVEVARSAGLNPHQLLANASLSRYALLDTEIRIPGQGCGRAFRLVTTLDIA